MKHSLYALIIICVCLVNTACTRTSQAPAEPIVNLADVAYNFSKRSVAWQDSVLNADSIPISAFLKVVADSSMEQWSHSRAVVIFTPDVEKVYPSLTQVENSLGYTLKRAHELALDFPKRKYAAVVYGRPEAILFVDSVMLIALNHFLGSDYPGYAAMPEYLRATKVPAQLPYAMAEALCGTQYPLAHTENATLLSRMLYEGVLIHAKMELVCDANPALALGYTEEEYRQLMADETTIWNLIVKGNLLYDTSETTIDRICAPAPFTSIGDTRWPGRVGRFIGWRIVDSYIRHNSAEATLPILLTPAFYNSPDVLLKSGY